MPGGQVQPRWILLSPQEPDSCQCSSAYVVRAWEVPLEMHKACCSKNHCVFHWVLCMYCGCDDHAAACRSFDDGPGLDALSPVLRQGFAYAQQPLHTNPLQDTLRPAIQSAFGLPDFSRSAQGNAIMEQSFCCCPKTISGLLRRMLDTCRSEWHEHLRTNVYLKGPQ